MIYILRILLILLYALFPFVVIGLLLEGAILGLLLITVTPIYFILTGKFIGGLPDKPFVIQLYEKAFDLTVDLIDKKS